MFGDWQWIEWRSRIQEERFERFLAQTGGSLAIIEMGAGTAVPTIRHMGEHIAARHGATLVRINPRDYHGAAIALPMGAKDAIREIWEGLGGY